MKMTKQEIKKLRKIAERLTKRVGGISITQRLDLTDELVGHTYLVVEKYYDPKKGAFESFVHTIMRHKMWNWVQAEKMRQGTFKGLQCDKNGETIFPEIVAPDPFVQYEARDMIDTLMRSLTSTEQSIIKLYLDGYRTIDIAKWTGKPYATILNIYARAIKKMLIAFQQMGEEQ